MFYQTHYPIFFFKVEITLKKVFFFWFLTKKLLQSNFKKKLLNLKKLNFHFFCLDFSNELFFITTLHEHLQHNHSNNKMLTTRSYDVNNAVPQIWAELLFFGSTNRSSHCPNDLFPLVNYASYHSGFHC